MDYLEMVITIQVVKFTISFIKAFSLLILVAASISFISTVGTQL